MKLRTAARQVLVICLIAPGICCSMSGDFRPDSFDGGAGMHEHKSSLGDAEAASSCRTDELVEILDDWLDDEVAFDQPIAAMAYQETREIVAALSDWLDGLCHH